ncbi:phenolic glucoside malonyltransferase 2-like [Capsella rubella]|uniref:phenolic glucoside malonyltransferase 2-like n=1 Tax=Capsella rubella TaxID=81985 RepID=UPI000CD58436|nr:phenolic glucoside malonyltransferase 2-like [Capsella rubella]
MTIHITETFRVTPTADSDYVLNSANSFSLPLTFFAYHGYYSTLSNESSSINSPSQPLRTSTPSSSLSSSSLSPLSLAATSLSLATSHGNINEPKPSIMVGPDDGILVTIAESEADFLNLSGYGQCPVSDLHALLPKLPVTNDSATAFSIHIGVAAHHAVLDGKTSSTFIKTWAHITERHRRRRV